MFISGSLLEPPTVWSFSDLQEVGQFLENMIHQCYKDRLKIELEKFAFEVHKSHIIFAEENRTGKDFHFPQYWSRLLEIQKSFYWYQRKAVQINDYLLAINSKVSRVLEGSHWFFHLFSISTLFFTLFFFTGIRL